MILLNFKELSKEEILSRQDVIIQAVLKEIYTGIKEYAALRNIGIVVDKQEIIYGKPLNITPEFVKWMKSYHKKYKEQYGDIL
jgi:Skp family chaperone for outer membrane proteins